MRSKPIIQAEPYTYSKMTQHIDALQQTNSSVEVAYIGSSVMGKPIPALKIGNGARKLHVNAAVHANEWITSLALMRFTEEYVHAYSTGKKLLNAEAAALFRGSTLWIVPMVNPDGVDLVLEGASEDHPYHHNLTSWNGGSIHFSQWKANIRGVDLNDQFPAHWDKERDRRAVSGPSPRDYTGKEPLSEPEAIALANLTIRSDFDMVISLHTQGEEIYWNYRDMEPPHSERWALRFALASGYRPVKLIGSDAGYKDWFIERFGRPGFTVEAGRGMNPLPLSTLKSVQASITAILVEALLG